MLCLHIVQDTDILMEKSAINNFIRNCFRPNFVNIGTYVIRCNNGKFGLLKYYICYVII